MLRYAILAVESPHDQAFVARIFKQLGFGEFNGKESDLDSFWNHFIPTYPKHKNLYARLDMPAIVFTDVLSVAIYAGEGSNLKSTFPTLLRNHSSYYKEISAFGIVADADRNRVNDVAHQYHRAFVDLFPSFPLRPDIVNGAVRTGIFVLPDDEHEGVLDTVMIRCGEKAYPRHIAAACEFINKFEAADKAHWGPFDKEKALLSSAISILKPGKTNTVSFKDNDWICDATLPLIQDFVNFLRSLLDF